MDFQQQGEEETVAESPNLFDKKENYGSSTFLTIGSQRLNNNLNDQKCNQMINSMEDSPSDSGVQFLDSESSEVMVDSITSFGAFDFDDKSTAMIASQLSDLILPAKELSPKPIIMTKCDFVNSNIIESDIQKSTVEDMTTSVCSTFDTENIVYRRRGKKLEKDGKQIPKKRVSFHEDILKNTRTDNIHIEHGFITYKNGRKTTLIPGRYSWCSEGNDELAIQKNDPATQIVYRNACSDVLDYGNADVYEHLDTQNLKSDNSGVFEYQPLERADSSKNEQNFYKCSCSSSNSSLDSAESNPDKNSNCNYKKAKSVSCDCIESNNINNNNNLIGDNCYFSEPSIDKLNRYNIRKSVWSKEKKPKTSCLKKSQRHTNIIQEYDLNMKIKKFNVHDVNNIIDNGKTIFGSLKKIFTTPLAERGVPEGSEDVHSVHECTPDELYNEKISPIKARPFLSKSLDGVKRKNKEINKKNFIHNVDEQLRRKNDNDLYAPTRQNSDDDDDKSKICTDNLDMQKFRNKFIVNCESTVYEHTGVSYSYESKAQNFKEEQKEHKSINNNLVPLKNSFMSSVPIKKTFVSLFKNFKETPTSPTNDSEINKIEHCEVLDCIDTKMAKEKEITLSNLHISNKYENEFGKTTSIVSSNDKKSNCSDITSSTATNTNDYSWQKVVYTSTQRASPSRLQKQNKQLNRHLSSPIRRKNNLLTTPKYDRNRISPDLFHLYNSQNENDSKNTIFTEDFDDILTITTDTDKNESDILTLNTHEIIEIKADISNNILKQQKSSLITRFLRNVTQKKIIESSIQKNNFFAKKLQSEQVFSGNLYFKPKKPINHELIEDLNTEISMEIEMSGINSPRRELIGAESGLADDLIKFELGLGEISIDIFNRNQLSMKNKNEILLKVFKLYTGYSKEGYMTPVLVFLTDQTLYVTDLVRNRLCNKFVLSYTELDIVLLGPCGNTVLLCNGNRDMQQVLLTCGPFPANELVANLEYCARKSGSKFPAVGQLTLDHFAPLQTFVKDNSSVFKKDDWIYYAIILTPAGSLGNDQEPLGPHVKGFLMHRRYNEQNIGKEIWSAGYFLLKAGVLYMFYDSTQKLPTMAMALAECQGVRRAVKTGRPHCFEILVKHEILQLAAPDEYVASEWLQALVQSASGLFEMQKKHKTLGCTLVMTENHLITLREDFKAPLKNITQESINVRSNIIEEIMETNCSLGSLTSTPTKTCEKFFSNNSTPTKMSEASISRTYNQPTTKEKEFSSSNMSGFYGKNSGLEVLTCAAIKDMVAVRIPSHNDSWWCILEFMCQEVRENSDDLVTFFANSAEMQRFLRILEQLWQAQNNDLFPVYILDEDDPLSEECTKLYANINNAWEPLLSAALGYPQ